MTRDALGEETLALLPKLTAAERQWRTQAGRLVFERNTCVKCHTTVNQDTPLAPSLKAVARGQKLEYLIESILDPNKNVKEGFEAIAVTTKTNDFYAGIRVRQSEKDLVLRDALSSSPAEYRKFIARARQDVRNKLYRENPSKWRPPP